MNKEELNISLNYFTKNICDIGITVYVVIKGEEKPKKLDIEATALPDLKKLFLEAIDKDIVRNDELEVVMLSSSDDRINVLYEYDIDIPSELSSISDVNQSDGHKKFNIADDIEKVTALLVEIGNSEKQIILYKTMARVNIYGRKSFFLKKSDVRFQQIDDEFFRITPNFQLIQVDKNLVVIDLKTIEKFFGFQDAIKREAKVGIEAIENIALLENPETLHELVEDMAFARKLTRVANASPVLKAGIPNRKIIEFCKAYPNLKGKLRFNSDESKIQLDTRKSKNLFIQILMDDFLTSELTNFHYTSFTKDEAAEVETQAEELSEESTPENTESNMLQVA
ncbi:anti-phage protein KwaB [uncultured Shewanella sp.]|uniref:anti-phage protein KwaB n=1 Tax=uncultured Shewanella sp. TaxID=173975 RepID=UPI00261DDD2D|nr:anti-phage protein KwaB [uncultured Shewanella sp.]